MARARRNKSHRISKVHDRLANDLPFNAQVATVEIEDPLALEPGEKIVTLRSIRNDPLGRLHSRIGRSTTPNTAADGPSRTIGSGPNAVLRRSIRLASMWTERRDASPSRKANARRCCG